MPEPRENQEVVFIVRRKGTDRARLGIVMKVNGENTLYREKMADPLCTPWVLDSDRTEFSIFGFQTSRKTSEKFKVLSQAESRAREMDYGEYVGTISISVFPEELYEPKVPSIALTDDGEDFATLGKATFPTVAAESIDALKKQLAYSSTRGLITNGASVDLKIGSVTFKNDAIPIMSGTVRYYHPQK